jgi:hypothetical protein
MQLSFRKISGDSLAVVAALGLGALVRLLPVVLADFPLNDGGLFYRMTQELLSNGLRLPLMTSYNGGGIPFAYPPLGFYLTAGLHLATGAPILELVRWLPAVFSILAIVPFYFLARRILSEPDTAAIAALAFALIPRSHEWMIMGGGLSRSPGMFFSLLCLLQAVHLLERATWKNALLVGVLFALATVSHLEMAWFTLVSLALLWAFRGGSRVSLGKMAVAMAVAAASSSFWWLSVIANHGLGPLIEAILTGNHTWTSGLTIVSNFTDEPSLGVFVVLGLLGAALCIAKREFLLPVWLFSMFFLDPRAAATDAAVPLAMLVALAVTLVVLPSLVQPASSMSKSGITAVSGRVKTVVVAALVCYGAYAALLAQFLPWNSIPVLRSGEAEAMRWIDDNLPPSCNFLVISGRNRWGSDPLSEWFPALTHAVSLATPQGKEWTGDLWETDERYRALQLCAQRGLPCLEEWAAASTVHPDYVLLAVYPDSSSVQTVALEKDLDESQEYVLIHSNAEAAVFARRSTESP